MTGHLPVHIHHPFMHVLHMYPIFTRIGWAQILVQRCKDGTPLIWEVQPSDLTRGMAVTLTHKLPKETSQLIRSRTYQGAGYVPQIYQNWVGRNPGTKVPGWYSTNMRGTTLRFDTRHGSHPDSQTAKGDLSTHQIKNVSTCSLGTPRFAKRGWAQILSQKFKDGTPLIWEVQLSYLITSMIVILSDKRSNETSQLINLRTY